MSTFAAERIFFDAVTTAEAVRQQSKAAAQVAYGFVQANYATYVAALAAADVAYITAINSAANTAVMAATLADTGPIPCARWAKLGGYA
jgi:hypothetical protein